MYWRLTNWETFDLGERLDKVLAFLAKRVEVMRLSKEIGDKTRRQFDERQREHVLRGQMRQIQKELGDDAETESELEELRKAIDAAGMPEETAKHARRELERLERMGEGSGEAPMLRTWLECMTELTWKTEGQPAIDIAAARAILDEDHYGLEKVKDRILEYVAVIRLSKSLKGQILCFRT